MEASNAISAIRSSQTQSKWCPNDFGLFQVRRNYWLNVFFRKHSIPCFFSSRLFLGTHMAWCKYEAALPHLPIYYFEVVFIIINNRYDDHLRRHRGRRHASSKVRQFDFSERFKYSYKKLPGTGTTVPQVQLIIPEVLLYYTPKYRLILRTIYGVPININTSK